MKDIFDKKQYDALNQRKVYEQYKNKRQLVYDYMGNRCELCERECETYHLHHKEYHPVESDYSRHSKAMNVRIKRVKEAEAHPERFALLCSSCHRFVSFLQYHNITKNDMSKIEKALSLK